MYFLYVFFQLFCNIDYYVFINEFNYLSCNVLHIIENKWLCSVIFISLLDKIPPFIMIGGDPWILKKDYYLSCIEGKGVRKTFTVVQKMLRRYLLLYYKISFLFVCLKAICNDFLLWFEGKFFCIMFLNKIRTVFYVKLYFTLSTCLLNDERVLSKHSYKNKLIVVCRTSKS